MLLTLSVGAVQGQNNDSLCVDFNIVSLPTNTPPVAGVDSICYEWKITNKSSDTLRNVMLVDAAIMNVSVPVLLPYGQMSSSTSGMITGNSNTQRLKQL